MKAAVYTRYGPPDVVVQIKDVEKPVLKDNEVLLKVRAFRQSAGLRTTERRRSPRNRPAQSKGHQTQR